MGRWTALAGAMLCGALLGLAAAWGALALARGSMSREAEGWRYIVRPAEPDAYARAVLARDAVLAPAADEVMAFTRDVDSQGRKLDETCVYELSGLAPPARWWSVSLYAPDGYFAPNADHAFSLDPEQTRGRRAWRARISQVRGEAPLWLSSREARRGFSLVLRVYNAEQGFRLHPAGLPELQRVSCPEALS